MDLQAPWVNGLTEGLSVDDIGSVRRVVTRLRERLEQEQEADAADVP